MRARTHDEWFGEIVVSTAIDCCNLVRPNITPREDQDGHRSSCASPLAENLDAIDNRQSNIKYDRVVGRAIGEIVANELAV
jgi:hypothetical protein